MYKFSANLGLLWTEMSQIDAIYKAKDKGFDAVEFQFPYQYDSREIKKALDDVNLPCLLYTSPSPRDRQKSRMPSSA